MKILITLWWFATAFSLSAQNASIRGQLQSNGEAAAFASVGLYSVADSSLIKAAATDAAGIFEMKGLGAGTYYLKASGLGLGNFHQSDIRLEENQQLDMGVLKLEASSIKLEEMTVTASRVMVEIKPDRTVFNVDGTFSYRFESLLDDSKPARLKGKWTATANAVTLETGGKSYRLETRFTRLDSGGNDVEVLSLSGNAPHDSMIEEFKPAPLLLP